MRTRHRRVSAVALSLLASLAACGDDDASSTSGDTSTTSSSSSTVSTSTGTTSGDGGAGGSSGSTTGAGGTGGEGGTAPGARCGDGALDDGEACDDGNDVSGDGCNADCVVSGTVLDEMALPGLWDPMSIVALDGGFGLGTSVLSDGVFDAFAIWLDAGGVETDRAMVASGQGAEDRALTLAVASLPGGDLVVGGVVDDAGVGHDFLGRARADGSMAWRHVGDGPYNEVSSLAVDEAGAIYAGGYGASSLRSYTAGGALRWTAPAPAGVDGVQHLAPRAGGGVLLVGAQGGGAGEVGVTIAAIADDGEVVWSDVVEEPGEEQFPVDVATAADGSVFAALGRRSDRTLRVRHYAGDGELRWELTGDDLVPTSAGFRARFLVAHLDGGFVIGGYALGSGVDQAVVARFDDEGNLVWSVELPRDAVRSDAFDAAFSEDGQLVVVGTAYAPPQSDGLLWRLAR